MYNYIGIINKSSTCNHTLTCNFLNNQNTPNLILAKSNILEIYNITKDGLQSTPYLNLYGRIFLIEKIPNTNFDIQHTQNTQSIQDNLFILTENLDYCILSYNKIKNEIINLDKGSIKEDIGKRLDRVLSVFSPNKDYAIISAYKNIFRIVFLRNRSKMEDFSVRYEYENLLFLFLFNNNLSNLNNNNNKIIKDKKDKSNFLPAEYNFGIIKVNNNITSNNIDNKSITLESFSIDINTHEIVRDQDNFLLDLTHDPTISLILSPRTGGVVIFFSNCLRYYQINPRAKNIYEKDIKTYSDRKFNCYTEVDKFRYLIGDEYGNLFLLAFKQDYQSNNFTQSNYEDYSIIFQFLGEINYPSSISYLDNNYIFIGSELANSQLVGITKTHSNKIHQPFLEVIEEFDNLAPISDFCIIHNNTNENSDEILCASGTYKSSCLKTVRKGTSIISEVEIPLENVRNIFSVSNKNQYDPEAMDTDDNFNMGRVGNNIFFVTMSNQTKILNYDLKKDLIEEMKYGDIYKNSTNEITIYATNVTTNHGSLYILQVTNNKIIIYDSSLKMIYHTPTYVTPVLVKYKKKNKMLYIYNKNNLLIRYNFENLIKSGDISSSEMMSDISSIPEILCDSFLISAFDVSNDIIIFSQWDSNNIFIFNIKNKKTNILLEFESNVICSSISFLKSDGYKYLFIALSNGKMLFYKMKTTLAKNFVGYTYTADDFILKSKYNITKDIFELKKIKCNNKNFLFINTELPALIYINKEFPTISNFNIKDCLNVEQITNSNYDSYLFLFKDKIEIGTISNSKSQNISAKYLNQQIYNLRNICTNLNTISNYNNVIAMMVEDRNETTKTSNFSFSILDTQLNEITKYTIEQENEVCTNFVEVVSNNENLRNSKKLFALGTGIVENEMQEPESGHIYLLEMNESFKLKKVGEIETKGGVYKIDSHQNLIFVGISSTLYIYSVNLINENNKNNYQYDIKLLKKHSDFTVINDILCHDNFVLVSDIYKSITVFKYDEMKEMLFECCRDYNPIWCYSLAQVANNIYLVSDIDGNIFSLRREMYPKSDEDKYKLERINQFNLGERINKLVNITKKIDVKDWEIINALTDRNGSKILGSKSSENIFTPNSHRDMNNSNNSNCSLSVTYFGTLDGTLGVIINIPKETYEFLNVLQKELVKVISSTGNLDYDKYRAFKDGFISDYSKGFVEGSILQEFLNFDHQYRIEFLKNIRYPWQININDTICLIESLLKLH